MVLAGKEFDEIVGGELEVDFFALKIQNILNKSHDINEKKQIKFYPNKSNPKRINFACPYCGDSEKMKSKKRGNLWTNTLIYECYNCFAKVNFKKFCDDFDETIDAENKLKIYNYLDSKTFSKHENNEISSLTKLIKFDSWLEFINNKPNNFIFNVKPIQYNSKAYQYLTLERNIYNHHNIYEGIYQKFKDGKRVFFTNVLIFLNKSGNNLLGIQLRNLEKDKSKRFFKIVDFEELYNNMNSNNTLDELESISYNKLSHFYNILNIDFEKPITIFEGYLDSIFCQNSIGMVGANNDNDILKFLTNAEENLNLRFFYDNDETGYKKAYEMINNGYSVFLWKKLFDDLLKRFKDKYKAERILYKIKDLNELALKFKNENIYKEFNLDNYFSIDKLDVIYIQKFKKYNK